MAPPAAASMEGEEASAPLDDAAEALSARSKASDNDSEKLETCRICFEGHDEAREDRWLCVPCACRGSQMYIHRGCARRWAMEAGHFRCSICDAEQQLAPDEDSPPLFPPGLRAYVARVALNRDASRRRRERRATFGGHLEHATMAPPAARTTSNNSNNASDGEEDGNGFDAWPPTPTPRLPDGARFDGVAQQQQRAGQTESRGRRRRRSDTLLYLTTGGNPGEAWTCNRVLHALAAALFIVATIVLFAFLTSNWVAAIVRANKSRNVVAPTAAPTTPDNGTPTRSATAATFSTSSLSASSVASAAPGNITNATCPVWVCAIGHMHFAGGVMFERGGCDGTALQNLGTPCGHWGRYEVERGCTDGVGTTCVLRLLPSIPSLAEDGAAASPIGGFCDITGTCRSGGLRSLFHLGLGASWRVEGMCGCER